MKRNKILIALAGFLLFIFGFFVHAYFFPYLLFNPPSAPTENQKNKQKSDIELIFSTSTRYVNFTPDGFSPSTVVSKKGNRLIITNKDKNGLMNLISDSPLLTTERGYGYTEALTVVFPKSGTFIVSDRDDPEAKLKVVVLP